MLASRDIARNQKLSGFHPQAIQVLCGLNFLFQVYDFKIKLCVIHRFVADVFSVVTVYTVFI
jgi:hypothetical protein